MWAVQYHRHGGPERLVVDEVRPPVPQRGQAVVRVIASGVSRLDAKYLAGHLPHGVGFPKQFGLDAIAQVVDGNGTSLSAGDWVAIVLGLEPLSRRGTAVELLAVEPERCGAFPAGYTPKPIDCGLVLGGLTALKALRDVLRVTGGQRVLVVGAGGPVGLAAIQVATLLGAQVDAVCGSRAMTACDQSGAGQIWDHRGNTSTLQRSRAYDGLVIAAGRPAAWLGAARRGTRAALTDAGVWPGSLPAALRQRVSTRPVAAGHATADLEWLCRHIATGDLVPVAGTLYSPHSAREAFASLGAGHTVGARLIDHTEAT